MSGNDGKTSRKLELWEALALSLGLMGPTLAMGGNGQGLIDSVGKAIPLVFVFGLVGVALIAYGFIRLTRYYNHAGSAYALVGATVGPRAGFFSGFALLGTYVFFSICTLAALGAFANALLAALQHGADKPYQLPWIVPALAGALLSVYFSTRDTRTISKVLLLVEGIGIVFMIILTATIFAKGGAPTTHVDFSSFSLDGVGFQAVAAAVVAAFLSWAGFEGCATLGEETDDPKRNIPLALLGSVVLTGALFVIVMFAQTIGFGTDAAGLAAFKGSGNTLGTLAETYLGRPVALILIFSAVLAAFGSHLSSVATASRLLFALSRDGFGPRILGALDSRHGQPRNAVWVVLAVTAIVDLIAYLTGRPNIGTGDLAIDAYFHFAIIGSVCLMVVYLMVEVGVTRLILSGQVAIPKWELIIPLLGMAVIVTALYFNLVGPFDPFAAPVLALGWCVLGLLVTLCAPSMVRSIGNRLAGELGAPSKS